MKIQLNSVVLILSVCVALGFFVAAVRAQQATAGHANNFSTVDYFGPPHQQQMKSRLSGTEARPLAGGLLVITQLKLEIFETNGVTQAIIKAPHCVYNTQTGTANSPGHLWLESGDGESHVEGDGFLWRQTNQLLTISNHVRTVIEKISETKAGL